MSGKPLEDMKQKLFEMNEIISKLDPAIRAAAFDILQSQYFGAPVAATQQKKGKTGNKQAVEKLDDPPNDLPQFISTYQHKKPADNVMLLAAWLYSTYGSYPIAAKEVKELGDACGLITPARSDNTMRQAKDKNKSLFNQQGKGWKPTIAGELFFKEKYNVKKGNKPLPQEE